MTRPKSENLIVAAPVKPAECISKLINSLSGLSRPLAATRGREGIKLIDEHSEFIVILILEGSIEIWRNRDELLVATSYAPAIIGLQGSEFRYQTHTFTPQPESKIAWLSHQTALDAIKAHDLMEDMITYQSYMNDQQTYRDFLMINSSSYEIICRLLTEISERPDFHEIRVEQYILTRTRLARSGVMKMLADLRFGGFIEMEKGKLLRINLPFPKNY